ncbi:hypothetical protein EYF80_010455 [Liparis tanakae]|uniref:Uncharacterized protein n=1 Tax=Liparis tanakae TaxID=230148 RepID=A0A4Z2IN48_9TELE|nr:hypothetical protein EYF80_010455 [Liparis tanakae]
MQYVSYRPEWTPGTHQLRFVNTVLLPSLDETGDMKTNCIQSRGRDSEWTDCGCRNISPFSFHRRVWTGLAGTSAVSEEGRGCPVGKAPGARGSGCGPGEHQCELLCGGDGQSSAEGEHDGLCLYSGGYTKHSLL